MVPANAPEDCDEPLLLWHSPTAIPPTGFLSPSITELLPKIPPAMESIKETYPGPLSPALLSVARGFKSDEDFHRRVLSVLDAFPGNITKFADERFARMILENLLCTIRMRMMSEPSAASLKSLVLAVLERVKFEKGWVTTGAWMYQIICSQMQEDFSAVGFMCGGNLLKCGLTLVRASFLICTKAEFALNPYDKGLIGFIIHALPFTTGIVLDMFKKMIHSVDVLNGDQLNTVLELLIDPVVLGRFSELNDTDVHFKGFMEVVGIVEKLAVQRGGGWKLAAYSLGQLRSRKLTLPGFRAALLQQAKDNEDHHNDEN